MPSSTCVIMAATAKNMAGVSDDSSSSDDDEVMKRCKEAVWETRSDTKKDGEIKVQQSKRFVVADHEHDGNELQVSEGFRTHVATKLGHLLEGSIAEMYTENASCVEPKICDDDDDAEGFRLFSTSVPGQAADDPPAPVRRRRVPSSSDSDSEMETRLREAAVSVKDLVSQSALLATTFTPSAEPPASEKKRKVAEEEEEESHVGVVKKKKKKRKKKRKQTHEGNEQVDLASSPHSAQRNGEQEDTRVKVKRKKKKKQREIHTDELN